MSDKRFQGAWKTVGYSKLFVFVDQVLTIFDFSELSLVTVISDTVEAFTHVFDRFKFSEDHFTMYARGGITRYILERVVDFQDFLQKREIGQTTQPEQNFEVFWHYFEKNYAFFQLHEIDWEGVYSQYRSKITPNTSPQQLEEILVEIIHSMNDSHVVLELEGRELSTKKPHALVKHWQEEFQSNEFLTLYPRGAQKLYQHIHEDFLRGKSKSAANNLLVWGRLSPEIGYLATLAMMDFYAPFDLLHYSGFEVANVDFLKVIDQAMAEVMEDFRGLKGVIVDARFNPGGHDATSFVIANRFADQKRLAFTKEAVHEGGFSPAQEIFVEPTGDLRFTGPVVLLTSEGTASAAEIFVHAMMVLPQVTRMGERTRGVLSDMLLKQLPNGWVVSLSNEIYRAADGNLYEGAGIPAQIESQVFHPTNFYACLHKTVDEAQAFLKSQSLKAV